MTITIEEISLNAWPSHQTVLYDGWILRFANGFTKRANSINPIYPSSIDLDEKIRYCEEFYQGRKLPVVFKLTSASSPVNLDEQLSASGYRKNSPTSVQVMDLASAKLQFAHEMDLQKELFPEWLDAYCRMSAIAETNRETLRQILNSIIPRHCFVLLKSENKIIACGLGVLQSGHIGLFSIVIDSEFRNRGYGRQVVNKILAWGKQNMAQKAYLQVECDNAPAQHLYSNLGFVESYQYWYRVKP